MAATAPTIVATSIGFFSRGRGPWDWRIGPIFDHAADLAGAAEAPKICYLGQATGDHPMMLAGVYGAFADTRFRLSHLNLFAMPNVDDVRGHLLGQDIIWVGGGSVANLMAVWRVHGLDEILRECWETGVVLGGVSAGSLCWHTGGPTDSFGPELRPFTEGLGLLPYGNGVHYDSEAQRRPLVHRMVGDGTLPVTHCTDDGVGLIYRGTELVEAVADRPGKSAYRVTRDADGTVTEEKLPVRLLA